MLIQSLNAELNSVSVFVLKFHSICCFFKRLAWLGVVKNIIAAARVTFVVDTVLRFESLLTFNSQFKNQIPSAVVKSVIQVSYLSGY